MKKKMKQAHQIAPRSYYKQIIPFYLSRISWTIISGWSYPLLSAASHFLSRIVGLLPGSPSLSLLCFSPFLSNQTGFWDLVIEKLSRVLDSSPSWSWVLLNCLIREYYGASRCKPQMFLAQWWSTIQLQPIVFCHDQRLNRTPVSCFLPRAKQRPSRLGGHVDYGSHVILQ